MLSHAQSVVADPSGRLAAMFYSGETTEIRTNLVLPPPGWSNSHSLSDATSVTVTRTPEATTWRGAIAMDPTHRIDFIQTLRTEPGKASFALNYTAVGDIQTEGLFLRIDLPWSDFATGTVKYDSSSRTLPAAQPANVNLLGGNTATIAATGPANALNWTARFDRPFNVNLQDKSNESPKAFTFWVYLLNGPRIAAGTHATLQFDLAVAGTPDGTPALLTLDPTPRYRLQGFGGNYCFQVDTPQASYTLDNLAVRWGRVEMSLDDWEPVNDNADPADIDWGKFEARDRPGTRTRAQFEIAQSLTRRGIPYVISVWRLPQWMFASGTQGKINPAQWPELVESIVAYLLWARDRYGAEPALFSFNEANIGINVLLTAQEHRDAIKRLGGAFEAWGLKTRLLLGDVHAPSGTIGFTTPAAADPDAMRYVRAVSFHSWNGGTPAEYAAWGDLAQRLNLPLLVAELGTDPAGWQGQAYNSFYYGLGEARMYQELLLYARPQGTMYWEFTADYSLLDGQIQPTTRFWLTKHFTDLTPPDSDALTTTSDQARILFTAFRTDSRHTLHLLNSGAARQVTIQGLPPVAFRATHTGEFASFAELALPISASGALTFTLPERCLVTLTAVN